MACPACEGSMEVFYEISNVPSNSCIQLRTPEEARSYPRGDIALGFCQSCGFVSNVRFDPRLVEYSERYEETQSYSPTFNVFHQRLAEGLIERHDLHDKDVIEIGCGKGDFLRILCELGNNRGTGFDPSYIEGRQEREAIRRINYISDFYSEKYSEHKADFIACKMTLEHIPEVREFTAMVRRTIGDERETTVFFQVPDATRILRDCAFEDIYYEHCSYFSPGSLARLFRAVGFEVLYLAREYDEQYLTIELRPGDGAAGPLLEMEQDLELLRRYAAAYPEECERKKGKWRGRLDEIQRQGQRVVLWGSGSKAVSFLTTVCQDEIVEYVVDINPHRQGHYMPLTAQPIVAPAFLSDYRPDVVVLMNRVYLDEVGQELQRMGLSPELTALS